MGAKAEKAAAEGGADEIEIDTSELEGGDGDDESAEDASARERAELASLLDGADDGDGKAAKGDKGDKKPEPKKAEEKPEGDNDGKGESLAKNWKNYRKARERQDARESALAAREAKLQADEAARAAQVARLTALERLAAGDVEALDELGLDFEKLTSGYLARQSGDKPRSREKDPTVVALEKRLDEEKAAREQEASERRYHEAVGRFEKAAGEHKILARFSPEERIELGNRLADELHRAGKKVPPPEEIAGLLAQRLRADAERMRALLEDDDQAEPPPAAPAAKPAPRPISSRDRAERGGSKRPAASDDERDAEREELLRMLRGG